MTRVLGTRRRFQALAIRVARHSVIFSNDVNTVASSTIHNVTRMVAQSPYVFKCSLFFVVSIAGLTPLVF